MASNPEGGPESAMQSNFLIKIVNNGTNTTTKDGGLLLNTYEQKGDTVFGRGERKKKEKTSSASGLSSPAYYSSQVSTPDGARSPEGKIEAHFIPTLDRAPPRSTDEADGNRFTFSRTTSVASAGSTSEPQTPSAFSPKSPLEQGVLKGVTSGKNGPNMSLLIDMKLGQPKSGH